MISSVSSAISATNAFEKKMDVISNNVANSQSDGFKKARADLEEGEAGGVKVEITQVDTPGFIVAEEGSNGTVERELSNVDLAEEIPQMIIAETGYDANLKTLKAHEEMLGNLLDTFD